jgi:transposase
MQKKGRYTREFKLEAIKLVKERGYSQIEAAKNLGVSPKNLSRWLREFQSLPNKGSVDSQVLVDAKELKKLKQENTRLRKEREILKKAAAFFASELD